MLSLAPSRSTLKTWRYKGYFEWRTLAQLYDELGQQDKADGSGGARAFIVDVKTGKGVFN